jgi:glutaconate CoA-transferase subunit A
MYSMVQAGSMGVPLIAVRGLLGSDILAHRPDLLVIDNPFNSLEQLVVAPPIRPDVAVFHALKADRAGNAVTPGLRDDLMMARAARHVIVTSEEIVDGELTPQDAMNNTFLPAIDVDVVLHTPHGAHPCGCGDLYSKDHEHFKEYIEAARDESDFRAYLERYVFGVDNQQKYLERASVSNPISTV